MAVERPLPCGCVVGPDGEHLSKACDLHFAEFTIDLGEVMLKDERDTNAALRSLLRRAADVIRDRVALIPSERDAALLTEIEAHLGPGRTNDA